MYGKKSRLFAIELRLWKLEHPRKFEFADLVNSIECSQLNECHIDSIRVNTDNDGAWYWEYHLENGQTLPENQIMLAPRKKKKRKQ